MLSLSIFPRKLPHILIGDNSAEMAHNGTFTGNRDDLDTYLNMHDSDDGYFSVIIGAVIAVVILVIVSLLVVILRYMYKHKGTYHTNESKGTELAESADAALRGDPGLCDTMDEGKREYFI
ncbi:glycophorin-C isoform X1 [Electrophorus electricus]|uniref:Neurexin/syndecan/glycophorin C domain-containing protein n=1 Tax=Electrophorus electricus TaxID=8005 RepID=A0AAY5EQU8_ELEEL|nr:glycophorin-C isoform X1 [Electrophorus electricus]